MNILIVSLAAFMVNVPLGIWRRRYKTLTIRWWLLVHASIPLIVALRIWLDTPLAFIPLFVATAILGQLLGGRMVKRKRD